MAFLKEKYGFLIKMAVCIAALAAVAAGIYLIISKITDAKTGY